jgi:ORF6N domain
VTNILPSERIERSILLIRGHKVMLDADLAVLYGVTVGRLNEPVKRNRDRFPDDFMLQLSRAEFHNLMLQIGKPNLNRKMRYQVPIGAAGATHRMPLRNRG